MKKGLLGKMNKGESNWFPVKFSNMRGQFQRAIVI